MFACQAQQIVLGIATVDSPKNLHASGLNAQVDREASILLNALSSENDQVPRRGLEKRGRSSPSPTSFYAISPRVFSFGVSVPVDASVL